MYIEHVPGEDGQLGAHYVEAHEQQTQRAQAQD